MAKPDYHGRTHNPGGTDPIYGYIHFGTNVNPGSDDLDIDVGSTQEFLFTAGDGQLLVNDSQIGITAPSFTVTLNGSGGVTVKLFATASLLVTDDSDAPIFRIDNDDGSVHILTGTSIIADL